MAPVAGIIVLLGGATVVRGQVEVGRAGCPRCDLRQSSRGQSLCSAVGMYGVLGPAEQTEARAAASFFRAAGVSDNRIILEERSRNTRENALFVREFVSPGSRERLLLVTSAYHMPRAVGAFRAAGVQVEAYPVDFPTEGRSSDYVRFASGGTLANIGREGVARAHRLPSCWVHKRTLPCAAVGPLPAPARSPRDINSVLVVLANEVAILDPAR